jgi:GNAT superfamily N-acetyltransferase
MDASAISIVTDPFASDAAMRELWRSAWQNDGPESFVPILRRSLVHIGAFDGARLVGFVNVAWDGGVHAFILDPCVHRSYQRQGIASRMLAQAASEARERGAQWLHVDFEPHLTQFYRSCGFGPTEAGLMAL